MFRVWRIEHVESGKGPFTMACEDEYAREAKHCPRVFYADYYPSLWQEFPEEWRKNDGLSWCCGFESLQQAATWFPSPDGRAALNTRHFRLLEVAASGVRFGKRQVIISRAAEWQVLNTYELDPTDPIAPHVSPNWEQELQQYL